MISDYSKILTEYIDESGIRNAILTNHSAIFYFFTQLLIHNDHKYVEVEAQVGRDAANQLLVDALVALRRQVKHGKADISILRNKVYVGKANTDLTEYLGNLYSLMYETSQYSKTYEHAREFEQNLITGKGFHHVSKLKDSVKNALYSFGCRQEQDHEEIFNESLVVLWQKLTVREIGLFFRGTPDKPANWFIYNKRYFQNSRLSTFLTGISRNLFLNRIRTGRTPDTQLGDLPLAEREHLDTGPDASENSVFTVFLFYRNFIEPRKLRVIVSFLQYDCCLEDSEVRDLLGINNARIHSCRLRSNFHSWYHQNIAYLPVVFDQAAQYLANRTAGIQRMNEKIRFILNFQKSKVRSPVDLSLFKEEFRAPSEFHLYHRIFISVFYLSSAGKASVFAGLQDEKVLRSLMGIYKRMLFTLKNLQVMLFLFNYSAEEPQDSVVKIMNAFCSELQELVRTPEYQSFIPLLTQLTQWNPRGPADLVSELYRANTALFLALSNDKNYTAMLLNHESIGKTV
jgi:hypothetical protein